MKNFLKLLFFGVSSGPEVRLVHPLKEQEKHVGVGFNFTFLLFATFGGLPLFFKGLWKWGLLMLALSAVDQYLQILSMKQMTDAMTLADLFKFGDDPFETVLTVLNIVLSFVLGFKGNQWAAHNLFAKGWRFADPASREAAKACAKWKLSRHYLTIGPVGKTPHLH